jgi:hypothetical protein
MIDLWLVIICLNTGYSDSGKLVDNIWNDVSTIHDKTGLFIIT